MFGGVLKWDDLETIDPDYFVLSSSIYDAEHYRKLRETQSLDRNDPYPYSVRLYQDLLAMNTKSIVPPQGIEHLVTMAAVQEQAGRIVPWPASAHSVPVAGTMLEALDGTVAGLQRAFSAIRAIISPPPVPNGGATLSLYRRNPVGSPNGRPVPLASSSAEGQPPAYGFDGSAAAWASLPGEPASGQFIGYDFGDRTTKEVERLRIEWIFADSTPKAIRMEVSDDGKAWRSVARFEVAPYDADAPNLRTDEFLLDRPERGRFWRVVADDDTKTLFGVAELMLLGEEVTSALPGGR
ncbi:MAG: discoidin domain-containing protein, partial [Alphaproteobacteria bacterium]